MNISQQNDKFNDIYESSYKSVFEYVICNASNIFDVEDIIQNIYYAVYKRLLENENIEINLGYILGIAKHKVKDYYRFRYRHQNKVVFLDNEKDNIEKIPSEEDIEKEVIKTDNINIIWNYLKNKDIKINQVFYFYYVLEYKIKKIAQILNLSESNVKHYLYRTLKELNRYIESEENNDA